MTASHESISKRNSIFSQTHSNQASHSPLYQSRFCQGHQWLHAAESTGQFCFYWLSASCSTTGHPPPSLDFQGTHSSLVCLPPPQTINIRVAQVTILERFFSLPRLTPLVISVSFKAYITYHLQDDKFQIWSALPSKYSLPTFHHLQYYHHHLLPHGIIAIATWLPSLVHSCLPIIDVSPSRQSNLFKT